VEYSRLKRREELCRTLQQYEDAYLEYLAKTWELDPLNFRQVVDDMEALVDLKNKLCPPKTYRSR
jgi:hypothetical protein